VGLVNLTVFFDARTGLGFPVRTAKIAYDRWFGQLKCGFLRVKGSLMSDKNY
jgi:hypothetical protein